MRIARCNGFHTISAILLRDEDNLRWPRLSGLLITTFWIEEISGQQNPLRAEEHHERSISHRLTAMDALHGQRG